MARQASLTRVTAPTVVQAAIDETVLRRPIGGGAVMATQLDHLVKLAKLPNVPLRIAPFRVGLRHGVLSGPFEILRFPINDNGQNTEPPTVFVEALTGVLYLDKPHEIDRYATAFANIWESALDERASRELISHATREPEP